MKKIAIVYASYHHGNTRKILNNLKIGLRNDLEIELDLYDILKMEKPAINDYDIIGFASGIYALGVHKKLQSYVKALEDQIGKSSFLIYTCGSEKLSMPSSFLKLLESKGFEILGSEFCLGYDTFGPLKLIGGVNKNKPNQEDFEKILSFLKKIL